MPKVCRGSPVWKSRPMSPTARPMKIEMSALVREPADIVDASSRAVAMSRKYSVAPKTLASLTSSGRQERQPDDRQRPGEERPDRRGRQGRFAAASASHHVAFDRGHRAGHLTGGFDECGGDRTAVHRTVVDAAEQDEPVHGLHPEGHRDEDRDRRDRTDARQDADDGSEQHAEEGEGEAGRLQRRGEAASQVDESVHVRPLNPGFRPAVPASP